VTVVVNCRFLTHAVTGVERYAEEMVNALAAIRSDLLPVAPATVSLRHDEVGGMKVQRVGSRTGHAWEQLDLRRYLRKNGDPFLLDLANTGPVTYRNQLVVIHDVLHRRFPQAHSRAFRWWYGAMTPSLARHAEVVATVSRFSQAEIRDIYGRRHIAVLPNAVGTWIAGPARRPSALATSHFFLVVGSHSAHKGIAIAHRAFERYRERGGRAQMVVVGGSHRSFAGRQSSGTDGVHDLGRVSDDELIWLYRHAHAFLFPSLYEGFGVPPLEAQAAGAPVIASDIPPLREVLSPSSAIWFPPADDEALCEAMLSLETRSGLRANLMTAGQQNVGRFSWQASASMLSEIIDRTKRR
jgi:glycosyltransferase involved in cell wall biosynthesis